MASGSCWFGGCRQTGRSGTLGLRRVTLCPRHVGVVESALQQQDRFEVRWGLWGHEIIARQERYLAELREQLERASDERADEWEPSARERVQWSIDDVERDLETLSPERPPVITIRERVDFVLE